MGIFAKIRKMFSKEITLDDKFINALIIPHKFKGGNLKLKTPLDVPPNFVFVLGFQGKALDVFPAGKFTLDLITLPECVKKFKLNKPDKNGDFVKKFKVDGYYISLLDFSDEWKSFKKMEFMDETHGFFKAKTKGYYDFAVKDAKTFLQSLLLELSYLNRGEGEKIVKNWFAEYLTNTIEKKNFTINQFTQQKDFVDNTIYLDFAKKFSSYGITIKDVSITDFILAKKYRYLAQNGIEISESKPQQKRDKADKLFYQAPPEQQSVWHTLADDVELLETLPEEKPEIVEVETKQQDNDTFSTNYDNFYESFSQTLNTFNNTEKVEQYESESEIVKIEQRPIENQTSVWGGIEEVQQSLQNNKYDPKENSTKFVDLN